MVYSCLEIDKHNILFISICYIIRYITSSRVHFDYALRTLRATPISRATPSQPRPYCVRLTDYHAPTAASPVSTSISWNLVSQRRHLISRQPVSFLETCVTLLVSRRTAYVIRELKVQRLNHATRGTQKICREPHRTALAPLRVHSDHALSRTSRVSKLNVNFR